MTGGVLAPAMGDPDGMVGPLEVPICALNRAGTQRVPSMSPLSEESR